LAYSLAPGYFIGDIRCRAPHHFPGSATSPINILAAQHKDRIAFTSGHSNAGIQLRAEGMLLAAEYTKA
jgi:hypothetical protein